MKSLNSLTAALIALTLVSVGSGCKKTPKPTTFIPSVRSAPPVDDGAPVRLATPVNSTRATPVTTPPGKGLDGDAAPGGQDLTSKGLNDGSNTSSSSNLPPVDYDKAKIQDSRPEMDKFTEDNTVLAAETVFFDFDRAAVRPSEISKVERVAAYLKNEPASQLRVEGNADERGTEEYNRSLGERRALAIRELLIHSGVGSERISTVTYGEDKPVDPGHNEAAWARNRRGDFVVLRPRALQ